MIVTSVIQGDGESNPCVVETGPDSGSIETEGLQVMFKWVEIQRVI